ncbi:MAG: class I adenylate-forming enzyme family protein [Verrucomicrobiales bacterium]
MSVAPQLNPLLAAWRETAARRCRDVAVVEAQSGRRWTFGELEREGRAAVRAWPDPTNAKSAGGREKTVAHPRGLDVGFLLSVLAGWESGRLVCPMDEGMADPEPSVWRGVPEAYPNAVLAKTTSGSTGGPRHILFSPEALAADARAIVTTMGLCPDRPNLGAISLAHSYGFSNLVLPLLLHGIPLVLAASPLPGAVRAALDIMARGDAGGTRATLPGVPALWRSWFATGLINTRHLALAISAGAPLPLELERQVWEATGVKIHNFLGSSECGGIAFDRTPTPRREATLAGTPLDGVALSLDAESRLVVHSPSVGLGYWPPEQSESTPDDASLQPGRFRTGDLADQREGTWHLLGRAADTINLAGRKLHPVEIESLLKNHPAVRECLVFGIPSANPARGEEVVAAVVMEEESASDWNDLPTWLGAQLPSWKWPRHWWAPPDLAATNRGKLPRAQWRTRFLSRHQS